MSLNVGMKGNYSWSSDIATTNGKDQRKSNNMTASSIAVLRE